MTLREYLKSISDDLNDNNPAGSLPVRWAQSQLLRYLNEGMCNVFTVKPNEFAEAVLVKLEPGTLQKICNCKQLKKILGQTDETGLVLEDVFAYSEGLRWNKKPCSSSGPFKISGYTLDPLDNGYFTVHPPVPPNQDVFIKALCANPPVPFTMADLDKEIDADCQAMTAARQWVMFAALMVDDESTTSVSAARVHLQLFFSLLNLQFTKNLMTQLNISSRDAQKLGGS